MVRQTRRVTLLGVRLLPSPAGGWEMNRGLEESTAKVRSFGGRIEKTGPAELLAAFGLEPDEDAPRRAAYAALAVRTLAARARRDAMDVPAIVVALHAEMLPVIREGDVARVDAAASKDRPAGARRAHRESRRPAGHGHRRGQPPPGPPVRPDSPRAAAARRTARAAWCVTPSPAARASSAASVSCGCCASASSRRRPGRARSR